jgi:hypothetical protein
LCLIPGDHELPGLNLVSQEPERAWNLSISGCGPGTRLNLQDDLRVAGLYSFALRDLDIAIREGATIHARQCREVEIDGCHVSGLPVRVGLVRIHFASRIYIGNSVFEAFIEPNLDGAIRFFDGIGELQELYRLHRWREFEKAARAVAIDLANRDPGERAALADDLRDQLDRLRSLSHGEAAAYLRLIETLVLEEVNPLAIFDHLVAIRLAVLRVNPGIALEIGELVSGQEVGFSAAGTRDGAAVIENNDISGLVSFYGVHEPDRELNVDELERLNRLLRERAVQLGGLDRSVHVRDNRLTRAVVAGSLLIELERLIGEGGGEIAQLIASLHYTDNVIDGARNYFVGHHVSLASNDFTLAAVPGVVDGGNPQPVPPNVVIGDTGIYTGNHGHQHFPSGTNQVQIIDVTRASAQAANLEIDLL